MTYVYLVLCLIGIATCITGFIYCVWNLIEGVARKIRRKRHWVDEVKLQADLDWLGKWGA